MSFTSVNSTSLPCHHVEVCDVLAEAAEAPTNTASSPTPSSSPWLST
ncbi:hypothetical protein IQ259_06280 [Fortiea sp. LEGE XX443]|nr:hypothetical protein [Fortiea sp. LEGE XX443]MBE9004652.1 hypothetical protein [Fortiea sp. LEGE XX443]